MARKEIESIANDVMKTIETNAISRRANEIKLEAEKLVNKAQRAKLLEATEEIQASLEQINRIEQHEKKIAAMEGEIAGVRKLIGSSREFQDWKVLVDDVATFKKTPHVSKDLFESEIKRLDQRIDSLKEIKFWSKRTILDIALAVLATASTVIVGLLGAGIIHF